MPEYRIPLVNNEFYHIYNRGVARMPTFLSKSDYERGMLTLSYYPFTNLPMKLSRFKELGADERLRLLSEVQSKHSKCVEIISFVLMPNHFHFILKQATDQGISTFVSQFTNSYTRYFNTKYERVGPLFQGLFKAVHIESDEQLIHTSRYVHINPTTAYIIKVEQLAFYQWSSYPMFLNGTHSFINPQPILDHFPSRKAYENFVNDQVDYSRELKNIKHLTLE
jgi:putative transposase